MSEVAIGLGDAFKRSCPTCKHPLGMHEGARIRLMNQAPASVSGAVQVQLPVYVPVPSQHYPLQAHVPLQQVYGPPQQGPPHPLSVGHFVWLSWSDGSWKEGQVHQFGANGQVLVGVRFGSSYWVDTSLIRPR